MSRQKIIKEPFIANGEHILLTLSIGIATLNANQDSDHTLLIQLAASVLAKTKNSGGNATGKHEADSEYV